MPDELDFERPLLELENRISELRASGDSKATRDEVEDPLLVVDDEQSCPRDLHASRAGRLARCALGSLPGRHCFSPPPGA